MPSHRPDPRQADLFFAYLVDLPLRDQADTMSLPVFSLGKGKHRTGNEGIALSTTRETDMENMSWVLYALLGTQIVLILLAARGVYYLVEIRFAPRMDPDRTLSMVERQTEALVKELRKIEDRIANDGQVRNELLRKLLDSR